MRSSAVIFCATLTMLSAYALSGCGTDPDPVDGDADGDSDGDSDGDADGDADGDVCGEPEQLVYITTDYTTGSAGLLALEDWSSRPDLITIHSDAVVICACGAVLVLERLGGDNLTVLSPDGLTLVGQHSLGARSNPYDGWYDDGVAYISLLGMGKVVAVAVETGEIIGEVDLTSLADEDGNPEPAMMYHYEGTLYVLLQLLDENTTLWNPTGPALIAMVTVDPFELVGTVELEGMNPVTDFVEGEEDGVVYVGHAGDWADSLDGGIERINLISSESEGIVATADDFGGNIIDFEIIDEQLGYATINIPDDRDALLSFNPTDGSVLEELASTSAYSFVDVVLDGRGQLIVTDRAPLASGLRVFDIDDGSELFETPIDTGIPPFSMCLLPALE